VAGGDTLPAQIWALQAASGSGRAMPGRGCVTSGGRRSGSDWGRSGRRHAYCSAATGASRARGLGRARGAWFASVAASGRLRPLAVEVVPSCVCAVRLILALGCLFRFYRSRYSGHGETAVVIARSWWRELVGDEFGGARWDIGGRGFLGVGRNPCRMADTEAVTPTGAAIPS
jgi:hypothetical protein